MFLHNGIMSQSQGLERNSIVICTLCVLNRVSRAPKSLLYSNCVCAARPKLTAKETIYCFINWPPPSPPSYLGGRGGGVVSPETWIDPTSHMFIEPSADGIRSGPVVNQYRCRLVEVFPVVVFSNSLLFHVWTPGESWSPPGEVILHPKAEESQHNPRHCEYVVWNQSNRPVYASFLFLLLFVVCCCCCLFLFVCLFFRWKFLEFWRRWYHQNTHRDRFSPCQQISWQISTASTDQLHRKDLKPWPNGCNMLVLRAFGHHVAQCCIRLANPAQHVATWSNNVRCNMLHPIGLGLTLPSTSLGGTKWSSGEWTSEPTSLHWSLTVALERSADVQLVLLILWFDRSQQHVSDDERKARANEEVDAWRGDGESQPKAANSVKGKSDGHIRKALAASAHRLSKFRGGRYCIIPRPGPKLSCY